MGELTPPRTWSPSKMSLYMECALKYRYHYVDWVEQPLNVYAEAGTVAHAALELLHKLTPDERAVKPLRLQCFTTAWETWLDTTPEDARGHLDLDDLRKRALDAYRTYFSIENPTAVTAEGVELDLEVQLEDITMRGIIDRLDRTAEGLVIIDYKSGSLPKPQYQAERMTGIRFYAVMVSRHFGEVPYDARLMYLGERSGLIGQKLDSRSIEIIERKILAVWNGLKKSVETGVFQASPSAKCRWCDYRDVCPAAPVESGA